MIRGTCPRCGRSYEVDEQYAGKTGQCRACGAPVTVPGRPAPSPGGSAAPSSSPSRPGGADPAAAPPRPGPAPSLQSILDELPPEEQQAPPSTPEAEPAAPEEAAEPPAPAEETRQPEPQAPTPAATPHRLTEHIARPSYEPDSGPTALNGPWLKEDEEAAEAEERTPARAQDVLSGKLVSDLGAADEGLRRPVGLTLASLALAAEGLGFGALFALRGGPTGALIAALGLLLAALGFVRLWRGHLDGVVPAVLHCACVAGTLLPLMLDGTAAAPVGLVPVALLAGAGLTLLLVIVSSARTAGYLFLSQHR